MKAITKIAALGMTLSLAFVLTACGGSASSSAASSAASASASASAASASASAASDSASSAAASSAAASSAASADAYEAGVVSGDTYTNKYFGIQFKAPEGWTYSTAEEMAQMNSTVSDMLDNEAITKALESGTAVFDMSVQSADKASNVNVVVEYAGTPEAQAFTAQDYVTYTEQVVGDQLEAAGATVGSIQSGTYENNESGKSYPAMKLQLEMGGVPMYQELIVLKQGSYFMSITATSTDESALDDIICRVLPIA